MKTYFYFFLLLTLVAFNFQNVIAHNQFCCKLSQTAIENVKQNPALLEKHNKNAKLQNDDFRQTFLRSKKNLFKIHYDTLGNKAPDLTDIDKNGVPDYIDSVAFYAEFIYNAYVNEMNFPSPVPDNGAMGDSLYDIIITEYGSEGTYGMASADGEIPIGGGRYKAYSRLYLDNNYSIKDSVYSLIDSSKRRSYFVTGYDALKVTLAHEFHHAVQFMYVLSDNLQFAEMSSTFMEGIMFPEIRDYLQYMYEFMREPYYYSLQDQYNANIGYANSIFLKFLKEKFDEDDQVAFLNEIWTESAKSKFEYTSLDKSLEKRGTSIKAIWGEYIEWLYYTGNRASNKYFKDAKYIPAMTIEIDTNFRSPAFQSTHYMPPLTASVNRYVFLNEELKQYSPDTLIVFFGNHFYNASNPLDLSTSELQIKVADSYFEGAKRFGTKNIYYDSVDIENKMTFVSKEIEGYQTKSIDFAYPNPFKLKESKSDLFLAAPEEYGLNDEVEVQLFTADMMPVKKINCKVEYNTENRVVVVRYDEMAKLEKAGVYIFGVYSESDVKLYKVSVLR